MSNGNASPELIAVLLKGFESKDLDYKGPISWDESDKKSCCAIVKDILGMANTLGGFIVIGVSETPTGLSWDGLTQSQLDTFDTSRLNRFLQNYADPPINARLRKIEHQGKHFVIIEVPRFADTPHVCQKEFPGVLNAAAIYVRTDNNETAPLKSSADFRLIVEQAVRNRADMMLNSFRTILTQGSQGPAPEAPRQKFQKQRDEAITSFEALDPLKEIECAGYLEATFYPDQFDAVRFALDQLRGAAETASVDFRGWPFLAIDRNRTEWTYTIQDGLETFVHTKDFGNDHLIDFWRLLQSGLFFHRSALRPFSMQDGSSTRCIANAHNIAIYVAEAIHCLTRLYEGLIDEQDEISATIRITGTKDRLLYFPNTLWRTLDICRISEITVERRRPLADWRAAIADHALGILKDIYQRFNWTAPDLNIPRRTIEQLFARRW
jgi:hypothetical protein